MKKLTLAGALLALLLVVFPTTPALAVQCDDVTIYYEPYGFNGIYAEMITSTPSPRYIFYTLNGTTPTHTGATPGANTFIYSAPISIPFGQRKHFTALCYSPGYDDSNVSDEWVANPPD